MKRITRALLTTACAALGACSDDLSTTPEVTNEVTEASKYFDLATQPRFNIDVTVDGELSPGSPIRVRARIRASIPTNNFEVRLWAPEVEVARRSEWQGWKIPVGEPLAALSSTRHARMTVGGEVVETATLNVPVAGYYRVIVSARAGPDNATLPNVQDEVHREVWLLVRRGGGRVTESFDPSLLPAGALPSPGVIRYPGRERIVGQPNQLADIGTPRLDYVPIQDDGDGVHEGRVLYINSTTGAYEPLPGVLLRVETFDGYEGRYTGTYAYATSDSTGYFAIECPWTGGVERYDGFVELDDGSVAVDHYQGPYFGLCGDNDIIVGSAPGRVYANMQATIAASRALLQKSRGRILVYIGSGTSRYEGNWDRIIINPNDVRAFVECSSPHTSTATLFIRRRLAGTRLVGSVPHRIT